MKKKGLILMAMVIMCVLASAAEARVFNWTKEGVSPFWSQPVQADEDLKALFRSQAFKNKLALGIGADAAKAAEIAVLNNQAAKTAYPSGTEFDWMLYGPGPTPKKISDTVRWSGTYDLIGFIIPIGQEQIFIGSKCVNILKPRIIKSELPGEYVQQVPPQQLPPQVVERPVIIEKPVYIEVEKPVYIDRPYPVYDQQPYYDDYRNRGYGWSDLGAVLSHMPFGPQGFLGGYGYYGGYGGNYYSGGYSGGYNYNRNVNVNINRNVNSNYSYNRGNYRQGGYRGGGHYRQCQPRQQTCPTNRPNSRPAAR